MQQIGVKENGVAWFHLDIDEFQARSGCRYPFWIGARLVARLSVRDAAHGMGAAENL